MYNITDKIIADFEKEIADAFIQSINSITDPIILSELTQAVRDNNYQRVLQILSVNEAAFRPLEKLLIDKYEATGTQTIAALPLARDGSGVRSVVRFDVRNVRAENWIRNHSSALITRITKDTRDSVQILLRDGNLQGRNPRSTALDIVGRINLKTGRREGGVIGLNRPQARALARARRELASNDIAELQNYLTRKMRDKRFDSVVLAAINKGKKISVSQANKMLTRYSDNLLKLRGETIARKEAIESLNRAQYEGYEQAIENNVIDEKFVKKEWDSAGDARVRDSHQSLDGDVIGFRESFISDSGSAMLHPGDTSQGASGEDIINCRCRLRYRVDFIGSNRENTGQRN